MKVCLPYMLEKQGVPFTIGYSMILVYFTISLVYSHVKVWITEPGFPEKISTITTKIAFSKAKMNYMSDELKMLLSQRSKGFVALLNSNQLNFTRNSNQCFDCDMKPLKPLRSYHCFTC